MKIGTMVNKEEFRANLVANCIPEEIVNMTAEHMSQQNFGDTKYDYFSWPFVRDFRDKSNVKDENI